MAVVFSIATEEADDSERHSMTTIDPPMPAPSLTARLEERILAPLRRNAATTRSWFLVTLAAMFAVHFGLLAFFLARDQGASDLPASREPTPIEVVVEKPQEPPKPQAKQPLPPQPKPDIEKPASSAPRAANDEKLDTALLQKDTHAPKAAIPPTDGHPEPAKAAASPSDTPAEPDKAEPAAAKEDVLKKDAEALDKAVPEPKPRPKKLAKLAPKAKLRRATTALAQLAGASALPDYSFARPTRKSPVTGGTEDSRYLAIVYGMIMQHRRPIAVPGGVDAGDVTLDFSVDDDGNVVGIGVERTSGYPEIDAEAAASVRRASPFPPPPAGSPHSLVATLDFGAGRTAYEVGDR